MKQRILIGIAISILFIGCASDISSTYKTAVKTSHKQITKEKKQEKVKPNFTNIINKDFNQKINSLANPNAMNFVKKGNVVIDKDRKLMWQDDKSLNSQKKMNWYQARNYCTNLKLAGHKDWRLPTIQELKTILDLSRYNLAIKKQFINWRIDDYYWSSTSYTDNACKLDFEYGNTYNHYKYSSSYVRCVRSGQILNFDTFTNLRAYATAKFAMGKNIENKKFQVKNEKGNLDKLLYTKHPFKEISTLTNRVLNIWLSPRKIDKPTLPRLVKKPNLPPMLPKMTKSQFETKKMFETRVNKAIALREKKIKQLQEKYRQEVENRNNKIKQLQKQYNEKIALVKKEQEYKKTLISKKIKQFQKGAFKTVMGTFYFTNPKYDAENQTMYVTLKSTRSSYQKRVALNVPINQAQSFYKNIASIKPDVKFNFDKNTITLNSINAIYDDNTYMAKLTDKDYKPEKMEVVLKDKKVDFNGAKPIKLTLQNPNLKDYYQVGGVVYQDGKKVSGKKYNDDIPTLLAKAKQVKISNKNWLFVIGIGKYDETDNIAFSTRSAKLFTKVAQKVLGVSKRHTYFLLDDKATTARILNNLKIMLREVKAGDKIFFYYNGHGIPDPRSKNEPYILPSDQIPDFVVQNKKLMLKNIYKELSNSKASEVIAFVDSCFSGSTDGKAVIKGVAATRLVPKQVTFNHKKMVVLTAGRKDEYSNAYPAKGERLFSYYLMKSLLKGRKDLKTIYSEVYLNVKDTSDSFGPLKVQKPTISGNEGLKL